MHSILDKNNKDIAQYIVIRDDKYSTRIFSKFYNMCFNKNNEVPDISEDVIQDLIKMDKYNLENTIHIYDLKTDEIVLKKLKVNSVMIYNIDMDKLYICTIEELNNYLKDNNYHTKRSINYVLGFQDTYGFTNVRVVAASSIDDAKMIYKYKYKTKEDPMFIGIKEFSSFYITLNNHVLVADIDEKTITKPIEKTVKYRV